MFYDELQIEGFAGRSKMIAVRLARYQNSNEVWFIPALCTAPFAFLTFLFTALYTALFTAQHDRPLDSIQSMVIPRMHSARHRASSLSVYVATQFRRFGRHNLVN